MTNTYSCFTKIDIKEMTWSRRSLTVNVLIYLSTLNFLKSHDGAPSLPRHLLKEACQKNLLQKVSFEFNDPDEGDNRITFMICFKWNKEGAKRKRDTREMMPTARREKGTSGFLFLFCYLEYTFCYSANKYTF